MRPLVLEVEGLRSFAQPVTVDFGARDLVAIVGDTGVGKSSLLEALTFALYSAATWTQQPGDLVSDRREDMRVRLTFRAEGATWRVTRTMSRRSRPSTAKLECLDGDRATVDGVRDVDMAVARLIGLSHAAFLQTVVLPQGRFAELLVASPVDRTRVLRDIFRTDELTRVRALATDRLADLRPRLERLRGRRSALPDDPAAAVDAAHVEAERSTRERDRLDDLHRRAVTHHDTAQRRRGSAERLDESADVVRHSSPPAAQALSDLVLLDAQLAVQEQELEEQRVAAAGRVCCGTRPVADERRRSASPPRRSPPPSRPSPE